MKIGLFKDLLQTYPEKQFRLVLPRQTTVPISFHITEVAHVQKRFMDCGGKLHSTDTCQLQAWEGNDTDHRLLAGKMAKVLELAQVVLPAGQDLEIEIEYEEATISQYPVASHTITEDAVVLYLAYKHTDCLAKESCCPPSPAFQKLPQAATASSCCGTSSCCQ